MPRPAVGARVVISSPKQPPKHTDGSDNALDLPELLKYPNRDCGPVTKQHLSIAASDHGSSNQDGPSSCLKLVSDGQEMRQHHSPLVTIGRNRPRLCKNAFENEDCSKSERTSRFLVNSSRVSEENLRKIYLATRTSNLSARFYTASARSGHRVSTTPEAIYPDSEAPKG